MLEIGTHPPAGQSEPLLPVLILQAGWQVCLKEFQKLVLVDVKVGVGDIEYIGNRHIVEYI